MTRRAFAGSAGLALAIPSAAEARPPAEIADAELLQLCRRWWELMLSPMPGADDSPERATFMESWDAVEERIVAARPRTGPGLAAKLQIWAQSAGWTSLDGEPWEGLRDELAVSLVSDAKRLLAAAGPAA